MKKLTTLLCGALLFSSAVVAEEVSKVGVLITVDCMEKTLFTECPLQSPLTSPYALYVHGDLTSYTLDVSALSKHELDEGFGRNKVTIIGTFDAKTNTIKAKEYKAPPPEGKSFFKGCL